MVLYGEVCEEDAGSHKCTAEQDGHPDPDPLLQVAGQGHEKSLAHRGEGGDPDRVRVEATLLTRHMGAQVARHVGVHVSETIESAEGEVE